MKKKHYIVLVLLLLIALPSDAQCAMCRAVLESEADVSQAKGINNGIVYLMAIPYILVGITIFYIYKLLNKKEAMKKS
ncbi:hypothetical protein EZY14_016215 [Kordia sp. TARA_039_SRF]|nr:hypothetical protein EZY14_016215 [Kordia sp. TARA_039_SRF]